MHVTLSKLFIKARKQNIFYASTDRSTTKLMQANSKHYGTIFTWITCSSCLLLVEHLDALGTGTETQLCSPSGRQLLQVKTFFLALKKTISITCTVCPRNLVHLLWLYYEKVTSFLGHTMQSIHTILYIPRTLKNYH